MTRREANADLLAEITALRDRLASLTRENAELQGALTQASDQQTATSEILRTISSSPTDVQPVFDTIVQSAARLCHAANAGVFLTDGRTLDLPANYGSSSPEALATIRAQYPRPVDLETTAGLAILTRSIIHVPDSEEASAAELYTRRVGRLLGVRSMIAVPMMRKGEVVGAINLSRQEPGRFSDAEVELLKTFADQAVIAIENVRLFKETKEALEQQTATAEILRVISSSPTDVQPVFDAIAENAARLCGADDAVIQQVDGAVLKLVAHFGGMPTPPEHASMPITREMAVGCAVLDRRTMHVHDMAEEHRKGNYPASRPLRERLGYRTLLCVPLVREDVAVGVIVMRRGDVQPFTSQQIGLVQTFADQAVIAIENVRLFNETKEALERQTATSEILRVISSSPTDTQPVFDIIAANAARLCAARDAQVLRVEGDVLRLVSAYGSPSMPPVRAISRGHAVGRAVIDRRTIHVRDMAQAVAEFPETSAPQHGVESVLAVPLLREDVAVGVIRVSRTQIQPFTEQQIALLQTFADQAVIAIENVRLFKELQTRNQELTVALAQQTATSEVLAVISGAQTDVQPVFEAIVQSARHLCDASYSSAYRLDGQLVHLVAHNHQTLEAAEAIRGAWPMPLTGDSFVVRAIRENAVIHTDMQEDPTASAALIARGKALGHRRIVVVPMVREGQPIGAIRVSRGEATPFAEQHLALLQTFADQAVIAIENVRLFNELEASNREIAEKGRQIEVASQHKSEFLANMSHELRTPLNAIIGFSEVLGERMFGELNEKQEEYLKDIHASGQHLLSLINDILDLSKIEAGRMELELTDFHLPTALDSALTLVRERAGRRGIALQMNIDNRLGQIQADERKVRQVVLNLLSNAIKFTPEGGRIEVRAAPVDGAVEVSVTDTGVGIAPEDQEAVFEEFRQVGTADKKVEGTGLGLTLCRKFVELHGGRIWVKSQVGAGSTFTFTIPARRGE